VLRPVDPLRGRCRLKCAIDSSPCEEKPKSGLRIRRVDLKIGHYIRIMWAF
jgi:hypothetical protein